MLTGAGNGINIFGGKNMTDPIHSLEAHEGVINVAKFSPSGTLIVSGGEDRFLKVHTV